MMYLTPERYRGKVAIVTGAGSGIGRAIVERIASEGAMVVANDLHEESLSFLEEFPEATGVGGDIGAPATAQRLIDVALETGGRVDIIFNNAGVTTYQPAETFSVTDWELNLRVNLSSYFQLAQQAAQHMIPQRSGAILNVSSGAGLQGIPGNVGYVAAKHGVVGLTRALAVEWARYGIRVNALCPGFTESKLLLESREQAPELFAERQQRTPLLRAGKPEEQAAMAAFLNSDESAYTTGMIAVVDGGVHTLYSGYGTLPAPDDE